MRTYFSFVITTLAVVLTFSACKKTVEPLDYSKEYESFTFLVDTTTLTGEILLGTHDIQTDITNELAAEGFTVNNLKSVKGIWYK